MSTTVAAVSGPATEQPHPARIRTLDALRLIAALMVVFWHYAAFGNDAQRRPDIRVPGLTPIASYGWLGVELFFLISGFVIGMSSIGRTVGEFTVSRIVRLFPAYWVAIALTATVTRLWPVARRAPSLADIGVNLTMLQGAFNRPAVDAVYWTLWAELRFYLLFAILVVWPGVTYRRAVTFCAGWLAVSALAGGTHDFPHTLLMPDWGPFFIAGIAFFLMRRYGQNLLLWAIVAGCFGLGQRQVLAVSRSSNRFLHDKVPGWPAVVALAIFFAVMAVVGLGLLRARWKWLGVAGALTYPLYLIHEFIGWTIMAYLPDAIPDIVVLAGLLALMLTAAWLIHRLVERPLAPRMRRALPTFAVATGRQRPTGGAPEASNVPVDGQGGDR